MEPVSTCNNAIGEIRRSTRRRMVQATLFPHMSRSSWRDCNIHCKEREHDGRKEQDNEIEDDDDDEEFGIQNKRKSGKKRKSAPKAKESRKSLFGSSPGTRVLKKKSPTLCNVNTVVDCVANGKRTSSEISNLRLEAKLNAEENSRMSSGKEIHPFFTTRKAVKKEPEAARNDSAESSSRNKERGWTLGPIHVLQRDQVCYSDNVNIDWKDWEFVENRTFESDYSMEASFLSNKSDNAEASDFENLLCGTSTNVRPKICDAASFDPVEKTLWTDKYQPKRAADVCGNSTGVKYLTEWLQRWRSLSHESTLDIRSSNGTRTRDVDYDLESDYNSEDMENDAGRNNVVLITGPAGSGKTAAIYACAKDQGFKILEISASDLRSGLIIKQKFGEALESQSLEWAQESVTQSEKEKFINLVKMTTTEGTEGRLLSDEHDQDTCDLTSKKFVSKNRSTVLRDQFKPLVLFEDVDIVFPEDRGLILAIKDIAETAKGPVILTSNSCHHGLPDNLCRSEICFSFPSMEELLNQMQMVCTAEKTRIPSCFLEQVIRDCKGDIRKALMHLQFWCQGNLSRIDAEDQAIQLPSIYDPDVVHQILPVLIPWGFPSPLSERVHDEIVAALDFRKDAGCGNELDEGRFNRKELHDSELDSIKPRKDTMLGWNFPGYECNNFITPINSYDYSKPCNSERLSCRKRTKRAYNVILSDSEDELPWDKFRSTGGNNDILCEQHDSSYEDCDRFDDIGNFHPLSGSHLRLEPHIQQEKQSQLSERATQMYLKETNGLVDVSSVDDVSFVPETLVMDANDSRMCFDEVTSDLHLFENRSAVQLQSDLEVIGSSFGSIASASGEGEDSQNLDVESMPREFQLMDQCSRMDFCDTKSAKEPKILVSQSLRQIWKELCSNSGNLKSLAVLEQKNASRVVGLGSRFSSLISETELLLSKCRHLDSFRFPSEGLELLCQSDEHWLITSSIWKLGLCFYTNKVVAERLRYLTEDGKSPNLETLSSSGLAELDKFSVYNRSGLRDILESSFAESRSGTTLSSKPKDCLFRILQHLIPSRAYMSLKSGAFHEYLSSLGCISRSEASRLETYSNGMKGRRARTPRHYLSSGSLSLAPEDISLLCEYSIYGNKLSQKSGCSEKRNE